MDSLGPVNLIGLAVVGTALLWTVHLVFFSRRQKGHDQTLILLTAAGWILVFFGVGGVLTAAILSTPLIFLLLLAAAMAVDRYRTTERKVLLWAMAVAAEKGYPIAPAVRAFADERSDELGRRAHDLAELLEAGMPLPLALEESGTHLPAGAALAAALHAETGNFAQALREAAASEAEEDPVWETLLLKSLYLVALIIVAINILLGILIFIAPTFREIFLDFDVELPPLTQWVIQQGSRLPAILSIASIPLLLFSASYFLGVLHYIGWLDWELPVVSYLLRRLDSAHILRSLAQGMEQGRRLNETLDLVARNYPRSGARALVAAARDEITGGGDWAAALEHAGITDASETALFHAAQRAGNLPWALREAADGGRRRLMLRISPLVNVGLPLVLLAVSIPIALCIIGLFLPLVSLISNLSQ